MAEIQRLRAELATAKKTAEREHTAICGKLTKILCSEWDDAKYAPIAKTLIADMMQMRSALIALRLGLDRQVYEEDGDVVPQFNCFVVYLTDLAVKNGTF
jgi:hypothetical protein